MLPRLTLILLVSVSALAELPEKYSAVYYEQLQGKEKARCDKYVTELKVMDKRKSMGRVQPWDLEKMKVKQQKIEKDYDKYCLRLP